MSVHPSNRQQSIAVLGGGVAGIVAAHLLQERHAVSLFDQNDYLGGHTNTVEIKEGPDSGLAIDTGFIVFNDTNYPLFEKFLHRLNVPSRETGMTFGFQCRQSGLVYAGTGLDGLFAQRRNAVSPAFFRFLVEISRFSRRARRDLAAQAVPAVTLGEYLRQGRHSPFMIDNYLLPMAAAIWSTPALQVADFPAEAFLGFFSNHGLLSFRHRPRWRVVSGGSWAYVQAFRRHFRGELRLGARARKVFREQDGVRVRFEDGGERRFDQVVIAGHADQALRMLADPSEEERRLLSPWRYLPNRAALHTDTSCLPARKSAWAAWNFTRETEESGTRPVYVTYYMNRLQGLKAHRDYCVTLNRSGDYPPGTVIAEFDYEHPHYSFDSLNTQRELPGLNGRRNTWFCGSYFGYGFHEDAVRSAVDVAAGFGIRL